MNMRKREFEIDFAEQAKASMSIKCDACSKVLGENWMKGRENMAIALKQGADESGYDTYKTFHACGEDCLREILNKRHKEKK